ncbi:hypothetical protein SEMRO_1026_G232840.1 [Seminavis robusta]|uniref:Uncharacterized protein n=1 Tax=Seminavis robusta TaxID=568900 RepID=A0A9N8HQX9_9STRA|nr:hypothetical protein SEMRO_1026_G232840.1 [Seminavis robusta]|eukprot:Sro1026_g232840.1 n/a (136) ;mRNA; f:4682-5326
MRSVHGPILGRIHQVAVMYDGRTIACPSQMEHFGCCVHEKDKTVTGVDPYFVTPNGSESQWLMRNGFPFHLIRRRIIAAMAALVKDDLVPARADDVPALLSRQCPHYDQLDDDSDLRMTLTFTTSDSALPVSPTF